MPLEIVLFTPDLSNEIALPFPPLLRSFDMTEIVVHVYAKKTSNDERYGKPFEAVALSAFTAETNTQIEK